MLDRSTAGHQASLPHEPEDAVAATIARLRHVTREIRKQAADPGAPDELRTLAVELSGATADLDVVAITMLRRAEMSRVHARLILERAHAAARAVVGDAELRAARILAGAQEAASRHEDVAPITTSTGSDLIAVTRLEPVVPRRGNG